MLSPWNFFDENIRAYFIDIGRYGMRDNETTFHPSQNL